MDFTDIFVNAIRRDADLEQALAAAHPMMVGRSWLIGGFVYRTLASEIWGTSRGQTDIDLLVENVRGNFRLEKPWVIRKNRFGNPKLIKGTLTVDLVTLDSVYQIWQRGLEATVENYLTGTPLNVGSVAFDLQSNQIIGDVGKEAIQDAVVGVNYLPSALYASVKKGMTINNYIWSKAVSLGFKASYPSYV